MLIPMKDGGLIDIKEDSYCTDEGCPTCGYDSKYISDLTLELEGFKLNIEMLDMYSAPCSQQDLMKMLCGNIDKIKNMTQNEFIDFIKEEIGKLYNYNAYNDKPKFSIIKDI